MSTEKATEPATNKQEYNENANTSINIINNVFNYAPIALLAYIAIILYIISKDGDAFLKKYYQYTFVVIIPILLTAVMYSNLFSNISIEIKQYIFIAIFCISSVAIYFYFIKTNRVITSMINIFMFFIFFGIVIASLAILYIMFRQYIKNATGLWSIILEFIFIIPCYFIDIIHFFISEVDNTPPVILIIFILEIIFILLYLYIPKAIDYLIFSDNSLIIKKPVSITSPTVALEYTDTTKQTTVDPIVQQMSNKYDQALRYTDNYGNKIYSANYSISFWLFLNPENGGTQPKTVLRYGNPNADTGAPHIVYANTKENIDELIVYLAKNNRVIEENTLNEFHVSVPSQRWNYIVITYNSGVADIWINGKLDQSTHVNGIEYKETDKIILGDTYGKNGYIKWLKVSSVPFTKRKITTEYNLGI